MDPVVITALDQEGRGITRVDGKAVFVEGALIGEWPAPKSSTKPKYEQARAWKYIRSRTRFHVARILACAAAVAFSTVRARSPHSVLEDAVAHRARPSTTDAGAIHGPTGAPARATAGTRCPERRRAGRFEKNDHTDMTSCAVYRPEFRRSCPSCGPGGAAG
jgi:23S rRNA (uracil1939-C5)-methyltransferase